ncbi:sensor protein DegS [Thermoclostridium stercorarium subsp. stercorarium DSM 8532]|uniref:Oxygen sensor histidine kinase NreB n=3 Tax=Thermoclostridium stercorarium TaxID=1510 RepID=L7VP30_THES1|nr:sensor histidine kinase [Thermoclostridium stercorarium]AGC68537.1 sensor protein DegS [Thermoclostridium stercorarium subsp. stercorarium DSM 8532]AGI39553.1 histidine kinase [Thermoclostridium stercorarium subsp. stercorarium DSM 8532]ANW98888.1 histidine kinase [Thermoclostridium stercorarium subsp. thermolacticum DSM 2910]
MEEFNVSRLNKIIRDTIKMIDRSREAIYDIAEGARIECERLRRDLEELRIEVERIIKKNDELEIALKKSRERLAMVSSNFDKYSQDDIRIAYEQADKIRVELAVNREREKFAIIRRNELERRLREASKTVRKAEQLINQVGTVMEYLSGDLKDLNMQLEDVEKRKYLAIRVIQAQEEERSRVAREIHDGPAQVLSNVVLKAEICEKLIETDINKAKEELKNLKQIVRESLVDVRRIIYALRPMSLEDIGLIPTLKKYMDKFSYETGITVNFQKRGIEKEVHDKNVALTIFRVVQEALNNVYKHSGAKHASVIMEFTAIDIVITVSDKGKGFNIQEIKVDKDDNMGGFGLFSMKERIELLDGTMEIKSCPGKGTTIRVVLPYV